VSEVSSAGASEGLSAGSSEDLSAGVVVVAPVSCEDDPSAAHVVLSTGAASKPFALASGSSEGEGPGRGVLCASSVVVAASAYPSGRDHQPANGRPQEAAAGFGGLGGSGGSSTAGAVGAGVRGSEAWTRPSVETWACVVEAGRAAPLLDLRLVRNFAGESPRGVLSSSVVGKALAAPPLTLMPMLSVAVRTTAGAFERQLPVPLSHRRPLGVLVGVLSALPFVVLSALLLRPLLSAGGSGVVFRGPIVERDHVGGRR
jgi:hypothetical protein